MLCLQNLWIPFDFIHKLLSWVERFGPESKNLERRCFYEFWVAIYWTFSALGSNSSSWDVSLFCCPIPSWKKLLFLGVGATSNQGMSRIAAATDAKTDKLCQTAAGVSKSQTILDFETVSISSFEGGIGFLTILLWSLGNWKSQLSSTLKEEEDVSRQNWWLNFD